MKGNLSIKGARFDGRGNEVDLVLNGHGSSSSKQGGLMYSNRGGSGIADSFTVRSSAPPNVASLMSQAQEEQAVYNSNAISDRGLGDAVSVGSLNTARDQSSVVSALAMGNMKGRPANPGGTVGAGGFPATSEATGNLGENFVKPDLSGSGDRGNNDGRVGSADSDTGSTHKYWVSPVDPSNAEDLVVIHVCDETRQISKDFCCKRDILVKHMKYFEKFLQENESGYDDIDISVHCDVEIFEWLMTYIHKPDKPPTLEKSIVVSILISSEFLQMDTLVEHCLVHIANTLNETIRLPIDLSCISDKIINRLAALTHPKSLANTKDRKDKILNKLYKRRVELDFSRKSGARGGVRTIAASLTCCRYCGMVYLDNWVSMLNCKKSPLAIDFNGRLVKTHSSIPGWSLTAYLKSLHTAGMNWDAIYWHVWASCQVFQVSDFMISVIETDRYTIVPDGLLITAPTVHSAAPPPGVVGMGGAEAALSPGGLMRDGASGEEKSPLAALPPRPVEYKEPVEMCLSADEEVLHGSKWVAARRTDGSSSSAAKDPNTIGSPLPGESSDVGDAGRKSVAIFKLPISHSEYKPAATQITPTLNPNRPADILPPNIYELICSQTKFLQSNSNRNIVQKTCGQVLLVAAKADESDSLFNYSQALWGENEVSFLGGASDPSGENRDRTNERGRSRSPTGREGRAKDKAGKLMSSKSQTRPAGGMGKADRSGADSSNSDREGDKDGGAKRDDSADSRSSNSSGSGGSGSDTDAAVQKDRAPGDKSKKSSKVPERRSRSMGALASSRKASGGVGGKKGGAGGATPSSRALRRIVSNPGERKYRATAQLEPTKGRQMAMFKNIPPAVIRKLHMSRGSVKGIWLLPHPLQLYPRSFAESMAGVYDTNLSTNKKHEWAMDLLREYDDKRLDRWEGFLASRRNHSDSNSRSAHVVRAVALLKQNGTAAGAKDRDSDVASSAAPTSTKDVSSGAVPAGAGRQTIADAAKLKGLYYADKARQPILPPTSLGQ